MDLFIRLHMCVYVFVCGFTDAVGDSGCTTMVTNSWVVMNNEMGVMCKEAALA
jgi:hypothetical protein